MALLTDTKGLFWVTGGVAGECCCCNAKKGFEPVDPVEVERGLAAKGLFDVKGDDGPLFIRKGLAFVANGLDKAGEG